MPVIFMQIMLTFGVLGSILLRCQGSHTNTAVLAFAVDGNGLADQINPLPDDEEMDKRYNIPALAQKIVGARADGEPPADATPLLGPVEIWARGRRWRSFDKKHTSAVLEQLTKQEVAAVRALCGRCLYHTLNHDLAAHGNSWEHVFVATGDIDAEWLRDSAVQLAIYLPRIAAHPIIRPVSC